MPKIIDEEKVFAAVVNVLTTSGYENATTKDLAAAAGMHEATLFRKYESKLKLVARAIEHQFSQVPLAHLQYTGDLEADLLDIVRAYVETNQSNGAIIPMLLIEMARHPELTEIFDTPLDNILSIIQIVQRYQQEGQLKEESPIQAMLALIGGPMSYYMFARAIPSFPIPPLDPQAHVAGFLHGRKP